MSNIVDPLMVCMYCGCTMENPTKERIKLFGKPTCCGYNMVKIDRNEILVVVKAIEVLKANLEKEILGDLA